jgi:mRNA-degrading endonuclease RelE of RelBE toxin-antitoxin system
MYQLQFSKSALVDLEYFRKTEQKIILAGIETNLTYQPVTPTKNRKSLRSNQLAKWELRIDDCRVF